MLTSSTTISKGTSCSTSHLSPPTASLVHVSFLFQSTFCPFVFLEWVAKATMTKHAFNSFHKISRKSLISIEQTASFCREVKHDFSPFWETTPPLKQTWKICLWHIAFILTNFSDLYSAGRIARNLSFQLEVDLDWPLELEIQRQKSKLLPGCWRLETSTAASSSFLFIYLFFNEYFLLSRQLYSCYWNIHPST